MPGMQRERSGSSPPTKHRFEAGATPELAECQSWPAEHLEIGGVRTFVTRAGAGRPLLLLHGCSVAVDARLTWFRTLLKAAQYAEAFTYDQPGFGRSAMPSPLELPDRLRRAQHAAALIDYLGLRDVCVVGHSEGGFIAAWLAIHRPAHVCSLVIVASGGTAPSLGDARDLDWQAASRRTYDYSMRTRSEDVFIATEPRLANDSDLAFETLLRGNYREAQHSGNLEMFLRRARTTGDYSDYAGLQERELFPHLEKVAAPALLVWGGDDPTVPVERGLALADRMPTSELHVFPRAGHWVMHDEPDGFNRLLEGWLCL